jgi:hypothetical protein
MGIMIVVVTIIALLFLTVSVPQGPSFHPYIDATDNDF